MTERRLRVAHVIVQPVLVWDDGEELSPGPQVQAQQLPLSALVSMPDQVRAQLVEIEQQIAEQASADLDGGQ